MRFDWLLLHFSVQWSENTNRTKHSKGSKVSFHLTESACDCCERKTFTETWKWIMQHEQESYTKHKILMLWMHLKWSSGIGAIYNKSMHFCVTDYVRSNSFNHFTASLIRKLHRLLDAMMLAISIEIRARSLVFVLVISRDEKRLVFVQWA